MKTSLKISLLALAAFGSLTLAGCAQSKTETTPPTNQVTESDETAQYTPRTIESFYTTIEQMWLAEVPAAVEFSQAERDQTLKDVLVSHESHLGGFDTQEMQDKAYSIVTQQVIRASR